MDSALTRLHQTSWWAELIETSDNFDAVFFLEGLVDALTPRIGNHLIRRELELGVTTVSRHLHRPDRDDLADDAAAARQRLAATLDRVDPEAVDVIAAKVVAQAVCGDYAAAAGGAEGIVGWSRVLQLVVTALRLERFDVPIAVALLEAGRSPVDAVHTGELIGRYQWWPKWLLDIGTRRALNGTLDDDLVAALDRCGYAVLTPAQSHIAGKLLNGDATALAAAAQHLDSVGEHDAAERLRRGSLESVALAAKLMSF